MYRTHVPELIDESGLYFQFICLQPLQLDGTNLTRASSGTKQRNDNYNAKNLELIAEIMYPNSIN